MKKIIATIGFCCCLFFAVAQIPCDSIEPTFRRWNMQLDKINTDNPEIITLHYFFLQDVRKEIETFQKDGFRSLVKCLQTDYYKTKSDFNKLVFKANLLQEVMSARKNEVDQIFYQRACEELAFQDTSNAYYYLDRALQFSKYNPDALLLKARLCLGQSKYQESVDLIHLLYTQASLDEEHEKSVSDFTIILYDKLYNHGTTLIQSGHAADALEVFLALELFCSNMPSGYCNDDYYRGILLSREGVYESYLSIAREAERRHNTDMAKKFYRYADEYKKSIEQ